MTGTFVIGRLSREAEDPPHVCSSIKERLKVFERHLDQTATRLGVHDGSPDACNTMLMAEEKRKWKEVEGEVEESLACDFGQVQPMLTSAFLRPRPRPRPRLFHYTHRFLKLSCEVARVPPAGLTVENLGAYSDDYTCGLHLITRRGYTTSLRPSKLAASH